MFNPLYLIETMAADGKELLESMLPFVSHESVIDILPEPVKSEMRDEKILSPEIYIKNKRAEIRELENDLVYLQGQEDLLDSEQKDVAPLVIQISKDLEIIAEQMGVLEAARVDSRLSNGDDEQLTELYRRLEECTAYKADDGVLSKLSANIREKDIELARLADVSYQSVFTGQIAEKAAVLKSLYGEHTEKSGLIGKIQPGYQCPSCFREITSDDLDAIKSNLQYKLKECVEAGKRVKSELASLKNQDETARQQFQYSTVDKIIALDYQIQKLKEEYASAEAGDIIAVNERSETARDLKRDIEAIEYRKQNGNLAPAQIQEFDALQQKKHELELKLEMYQAILDKPDFKEQVIATEKRIAMLKSKVSSAALYIGKKNELLFKDLSMNRVQILLNEIVKSTGEIKDIFKFTYDGREYKRLSLSEKIRAGLEVAELVKRLSGLNFPSFIDNGESVCIIDNVRPTSQLILSYVEKGKPLTVTHKEMLLRKAA